MRIQLLQCTCTADCHSLVAFIPTPSLHLRSLPACLLALFACLLTFLFEKFWFCSCLFPFLFHVRQQILRIARIQPVRRHNGALSERGAAGQRVRQYCSRRLSRRESGRVARVGTMVCAFAHSAMDGNRAHVGGGWYADGDIGRLTSTIFDPTNTTSEWELCSVLGKQKCFDTLSQHWS